MGTRVDNLENQIFDLKEQLSFVISEMNRLEEQSKSLQAELDKEVKDNRILLRALKTIVKMSENGAIITKLYDIERISLFALKKIGEEE